MAENNDQETVNTEDQDIDAGNVSEEELVEQEEQAKQEFSSGFNKVAGTDPSTSDKDADEDDEAKLKAEQEEAERQAEEEAAAKEKEEADRQAAEAARDKALSELPEFMSSLKEWKRTVDGTLGSIPDRFKSLEKTLSTAKQKAADSDGDGPTDKEIDTAMSDPEAMKQLIEDYGEFKPFFDELQSLRAAVQKSNAGQGIDPEEVDSKLASVREESITIGRQLARLDNKYPDWEAEVKTEDFGKWMETQPDDVKALAASNSAVDAITMLDKYDEHKKDVAKKLAAEEKQKQNDKRLKRAITPSGSGTETTSGINDDQAFKRGFNKVRAGSLI